MMKSETNLTSCTTTPVFVISSGRAAEEFRCSFSESPLFHQSSTRFETNLKSYLAHCRRFAESRSVANQSSNQTLSTPLDSWFAGILTNQTPYTLISIEYDSILQLDRQGPKGDVAPHFIRWLVSRKFPVVHVVGNNPLDCFVDRILSDCDGSPTPDRDMELAAVAMQQINKMNCDANLFRKWLADARLLEINYTALFNPMGAISNLVVRKFSYFLEVEDRRLKTGTIYRRRDPGRTQAAIRMKRVLRPELTRAGYEKLFDLPKAA